MSIYPDPEMVIQQRLEAYNRRDIDVLIALYAEDAEMFEHPGKLVARGRAALRQRFMLRFQEPNLHATLLHRIVMGNIVIDHEKVARTFPEGAGTVELTMIYEVNGGRISKAWSISGPKTVAP